MTLNDILEVAHEKGISQEDLIDEIWEIQASTIDKVNLSLALFDIQPTYHILTSMWFNYWISTAVNEESTDIILNKYFIELSDPTKNLSDSMEYSLYFDIFEDPDNNEYAWNYFIRQKPNDHFLRIILQNSGPVPYQLKHELYAQLISQQAFHLDIYRSIRHSCFDNCGRVDKHHALETLKQLDLLSEMKQINTEAGFRKYEQVLQYLNNNGN